MDEKKWCPMSGLKEWCTPTCMWALEDAHNNIICAVAVLATTHENSRYAAIKNTILEEKPNGKM